MIRFVAALALATVVSTFGAQAPTLGRIHFPTSGGPGAQATFLEGVALLHSFEYDDAIAAFRRARVMAPGFAMAYWGEALAHSQPLWYREDVTKARAVLAMLGPTRAARAAKAATDRERAYLAAVEELFDQGDKVARAAAYARAMEHLSAAHPEDDEAAAFYALAMLATIPEGTRNTAVSLKAGAIASVVLERNPDHPGAAHYALHAYDDGEHNRMGLKAARLFARIAPQSSHALHMPSHVFLPLGMWDESAASNEASFAASVARAKRTGRSAAQHDVHSLSWLHYSYLQQGRFQKARETEAIIERVLAASKDIAASHAGHAESEIGRGYGSSSLKNELASMRARGVVESRDWARMKGAQAFGNIDELFALGLSSVALGDIGRADAALKQLRVAGISGPQRDLRDVAAIMADEIDGLLRFAGGDRTGALTALRRAAAAESARPRPIARPYPIKPAGELLAEILLASGDAAGAVRQFRAVLDRTPRRAAALFGLAMAQAAAEDATAAATAREFVEMWRGADRNRPELADARALID